MFEKVIKDSFDNYETAYDPKDWPVFESKLNRAIKFHFLNKIKLFSIIGSAIIISAVALYFINNNLQKPNTPLSANNANHLSVAGTQNHVVAPADIKNTPSASYNNNIVKNNFIKPAQTISEKAVIEKSDIQGNKEIKKQENTGNEKQETPPAVENAKPVSPSEPYSLSIDASKVVACADEEIIFYPSVKGQNYQYTWNFGDDNISSVANPSHAFTKAGNYDVRLTLTDKNTRAVSNATLMVQVNKKPEAGFDYDITQEGLAYPQVKFYDKSADAMHWEWGFGDGKISYEQNPVHVYFINSDKKINVSLTATNTFGCKNKYEKTITFSNVFDLMAPNAFSPDGDGLNDFFMPKALELYDIPFELFIYDRSGTMVFTSKSKSNPWDGRIGVSGNIPESGTYVWIVIIKDKSGSNIKYSGTVSIVM
ncbi:MAG: PKD domain protein [Bacteroidetes bacterium ADurb.Bin408]|nr:MAG: PKD domain protein [Bacteroidetes bacterium ADurb.Bin408]